MTRIVRPYLNTPPTPAAAAPELAKSEDSVGQSVEDAKAVVTTRLAAEEQTPFHPKAPEDAEPVVVEPATPGAMYRVGGWSIKESAEGVVIGRGSGGDGQGAEVRRRGVTLRLGEGAEEITIMIARTGLMEGEDDASADVRVRDQTDTGSEVQPEPGGTAA